MVVHVAMTADQRIAAADDLTSAEQRVRANIERVAHQSGWSLGTLHADFDAYVAAVKQAVDAAYTGEAARWEDAVETVRQGRASAAYRVQRVRDAFRVVPEAGTPTGEPPRCELKMLPCPSPTWCRGHGKCWGTTTVMDDSGPPPEPEPARVIVTDDPTGEPDATEGPATLDLRPKCEGCGEPIEEKPAVGGLDTLWHPVCWEDCRGDVPGTPAAPTVEPPEPAPGPKRPEYEPRTEAQRLGYLIEECGEVLAAAGKSLRWGYDSTNPELPPDERETNAAWLRRELGDLREAISRVLPDLEAHR